MILTDFPEQTTVIAKDQPEYRPMPAHVTSDGTVTCCWKLTWFERLRLLVTARLWHQVLTFNRPLQPQLLLVAKPEFPRCEHGVLLRATKSAYGEVADCHDCMADLLK